MTTTPLEATVVYAPMQSQSASGVTATQIAFNAQVATTLAGEEMHALPVILHASFAMELPPTAPFVLEDSTWLAIHALPASPIVYNVLGLQFVLNVLKDTITQGPVALNAHLPVQLALPMIPTASLAPLAPTSTPTHAQPALTTAHFVLMQQPVQLVLLATTSQAPIPVWPVPSNTMDAHSVN